MTARRRRERRARSIIGLSFSPQVNGIRLNGFIGQGKADSGAVVIDDVELFGATSGDP